MHLLILAQEDTASGGNAFATLLPLLLIGVFVWFVMIRPQKKRQQQFKEMQSELGVGDTVYTIGGLMGVVDEIGDDHVDLAVTNDGTILRFKRSSIAEILKNTDLDDDLEETDVADEAAS